MFFIVNGLRIGKTNSKLSHEDELERWTAWFLEKVEDLGDKSEPIGLIVNGNTFDTKRFITPRSARTFHKFLGEVEKVFDFVHINLGHLDLPSSRDLSESLFDVVKLPRSARVVDSPFKFSRDKISYGIYPYGTLKSISDDSISGELDFIFTTEKVEAWPESGQTIVSGYSSEPTTVDNVVTLGIPFQQEWEDINTTPGFWWIDAEAKLHFVEYDRRAFHSVKIVDGKIDGVNPIKWVTNNRDKIEGTLLEIVVDGETDRTLYQKLVSVLETVRLRELRMTEDVRFTAKPLSESGVSVIESINNELTRPGAKRKLAELAETLGV